MAYYFALVRHVGVFTFAIEVAVAGACIGGLLNGVDRLLKEVVYELIVCEMEFCNIDAIEPAGFLAKCIRSRQHTG